MRILSFDPGKDNFAFTLIDHGKSTRVLSCGMFAEDVLFKQINDVDISGEIAPFYDSAATLIGQSKPDVIIAERYVARMHGPTIEFVNMMLGVIAIIAIDDGATFATINSGQWKNAVNKEIVASPGCFNFGDQKVKKNRPIEAIKKWVTIPGHVVDAAFIGLYALHQSHRPNAYRDLAAEAPMREFLSSLESRCKLNVR